MSADRSYSVAAQAAALVADIQNHRPSVEAGLAELVESAQRQVPGARYAGITLAEHGPRVQTVAATHRYPRELDDIQQRHHEGPCLAAAWDHHTVVIDDVGAERRWPRFARDAAASTPIRSILSFELAVNPTAMTALNFYAESPHAFDADAREIGLIFATNTALAWTIMRRDLQFQSALASRDTIGQAKGMLMERYRIDAVQAFELLKRLSQQTNAKLADVAARLIASEDLDDTAPHPG